MGRTEESGGYLGGIGAMLEAAGACPLCGLTLPKIPSLAARHREGRGCRPLVYAALPDADPTDREMVELPPAPAWRRIRGFETPMPEADRIAPADPKIERRPGNGTTRPLAVAWLPPPDLGEVF